MALSVLPLRPRWLQSFLLHSSLSSSSSSSSSVFSSPSPPLSRSSSSSSSSSSSFYPSSSFYSSLPLPLPPLSPPIPLPLLLTVPRLHSLRFSSVGNKNKSAIQSKISCLYQGFPSDPSSQSEFLLNSGTVVRTLRAELPLMFEKELTYSIYSPNILFYEEAVGHVGISGLKHYKWLIKSLRSVARMYYQEVNLDLLGFTQRAPGVIAVRWTFTGAPRRLLLLPKSGLLRTLDVYDGVFVYKLNEKGWVREHILETILPAPPELLRNIRDMFGVHLTPEMKGS